MSHEPGAADAPPLRIGILGAARLAPEAVVAPARRLGHRVVAVAARDRTRAAEFAAAYGVERVHETYQDLLEDQGVDLVYNPLVTFRRAPLSSAALRAGKHVLSEHPLGANAAEVRSVLDLAWDSPGVIVEGFHYLHHPVHSRLYELVTSGELGTIERVEIELKLPPPPPDHPRWSLTLAGGSTMGVGCSVIHALRRYGTVAGGPPTLTAATATVREGLPGLDEAMRIEVVYPDGTQGRGTWSMTATDRRMVWTVVGSLGTAVVPAFALPHTDPRVIVSGQSDFREETHGDRSSYTYQLEALARCLAGEEPYRLDLADSVANAQLIDDCYRKAGLEPRPSALV